LKVAMTVIPEEQSEELRNTDRQKQRLKERALSVLLYKRIRITSSNI